MRKAMIAGLLAAVTFAAANSRAQVSAHHGEPTPETDVEVASPMVVEVRLPSFFGSLSPPPGSALQREFTGTHRFVCDKARIERLKVSRTTDKLGHAVISFEPKVSTGWFRQHVKLKLEVVAGDKTLLAEESRLVIGTESAGAEAMAERLGKSRASTLGLWGTSSTKAQPAELTLDDATWKAAFADGAAPVVRMTLAIED
jgi:hypothetical protein